MTVAPGSTLSNTKARSDSEEASATGDMRQRPNPFGSKISIAIHVRIFFPFARTPESPASLPPMSVSSTATFPRRRSRSGRTTADRRLVGIGIATMSEEGSGILSGNAVASGSECLLQRLDGARGDPAEVGFHLGPARLDRAEVRAVAGQIAIGKA